MGSFPEMRRYRGERGFAVVYLAIIIVAICAMLAIAVDIGYVYVAKSQLQNAADAASLAGACRLPDQPAVRTEAVAIAEKHIAAATPVRIRSDGSNSLSTGNDVTVGYYNSTAGTYVPGGTPVNAVQARARRTEASGDQSRVALFFARVIGRNDMAVSATAIAARLPAAGVYFMLGRQVCNDTIPAGGLHLSPATDPALGTMAWTSLLDPNTSANYVDNQLICSNEVPQVDVCGNPLFTTNGVVASLYKDLESLFYDPHYDSGNKTFNASNQVTTWTVIAPVTNANDPTTQNLPYDVYGYARIVITRACGSGNADGCTGFHIPPSGSCTGGENDIVISSITCVTCAERDSMVGSRAQLVR